MFTYPSANPRGKDLLALLGTFWSQTYAQRDVVETLLQARAEVEEQNWLNMMEALQSFSRYEVPIFHKKNWHLHTIRKRDWDGNIWKGPDGLVHAPVIMNRLADPSAVLTAGVDYDIRVGRDGTSQIDFVVDPFDDARWGTRPVLFGDEQIDTELFLWIFKGDFDIKQVYEHWGYVLGLALPSSAAYRDLLNVLFDAITSGTAAAQVQLAYAIMTGLPLAKGQETIEELAVDERGTSIITNANAYRVPPGANPTVVIGDVVVPGQSLTDGLLFADLSRGEVPDWVDALVFGRGMLVGRFHSDLVFDNQDMPLTVTTDDQGYTRVEFPIGGFPLDVEAFWDATHARGLESGRTLAEAMDTRTNTEGGQPGPSNLPTTVNPVRFLAEHVLRYNCVLVKVKMGALSPDAIGLSPARLLRSIAPPGSAVLVLIEVSPKTDSVILNDAPTAAAPGGISEIGSFSGANPVSETMDVGRLPYRVSAWSVAGTCR